MTEYTVRVHIDGHNDTGPRWLETNVPFDTKTEAELFAETFSSWAPVNRTAVVEA